MVDFEFVKDEELFSFEGLHGSMEERCSAARPFRKLHSTKSDRAVLLIHGYTGYPGELVRPARDLFEAGFDIFVPRLPGSGTTGEDFLLTNRFDWVEAADRALKRLLDEYSDVTVLGHSMGGAIAAIVAERNKRVSRAILACPALAENKKGLPAKPFTLRLLALFKRRIPNSAWKSDSEYKMYYEGAPKDDAYLGSQYWSWIYPKGLCELFALMLESGRAVKNITAPVLTIVSSNDQVLGLSPLKAVESRANKNDKIVQLEGATHYLFYDKDKSEEEKAVKAVLSFCSEL